MAQDSNELVVASHGDVYVAPAGTAVPATNDADAALNAAFDNLGYLTEDGVTLTVTPNIQEFMAWQTRHPVRRELVSQDISLACTLEQWNVDNIAIAFGGGTVVETASGVFKYEFLDDDDTLAEYVLVVDWQDGTKKYRVCFSRVNVTETVSTQLQRSALATLPLTFKVLAPEDEGAPGFFLAEDTAFSAVS